MKTNSPFKWFYITIKKLNLSCQSLSRRVWKEIHRTLSLWCWKMHSIIHLIRWSRECFRWLVSMQLVTKWSTMSSGRTQVRSAREEEGMGERRVFEGSGSWGGEGGLGFSNRERWDLGWRGGWFRGFVFISSWVLPPGVGQYPSHAVSCLFGREEEHMSYTTDNWDKVNMIIWF